MRKLNILIVDDIEANIISLQYLLDEYFSNLNIIAASNGEDALKFAFENSIDLIILDIQMPQMDGFEVAKYLKLNKRTKHIPIIFLTAAFKEEEFATKGYSIGAVDYLTKPIDNNQFINKLKLYIEVFTKNIELQEQKREQDILLSLFDIGDSVLFKWYSDDALSVEYVSSSIEKLLGYKVDEFLSHKVSYKDCIYKDDISIVLDSIKNMVDKDEKFFKLDRYRLVTKDGDIKWVKSYIVLVRDAKGSISNYIGYINDITDDVKKENILAEQSKMAAMGDMIANIAHQWRQPLSVISTAASGMKLEKEFGVLTDEKFIYNCDSIEKNAQYLSKTIDDFRDFIKGGSVSSNIKLKELVDSFLELIDASATMHQIKIILKNIEDSEFNGYKNELIQCFMNLYNNSKDVLINLPEDERFIFISAYIKDEKVVFEFSDNGGGIDESIIDRIFDPYFTTKHQSQGTGLGLSMTYNMISEGMSGEITVQNTIVNYNNSDYTGVLFTITLPL